MDTNQFSSVFEAGGTSGGVINKDTKEWASDKPIFNLKINPLFKHSE
jgi:hypothetical protein